MYKVEKHYYTNARKSIYNGKIYDSNFEAGFARELDLRKKAGDIKDWEQQVNLDLIVNGYKVCTYRIDFVVHHNDGTTEYIECKGYPTPVWRLKWKLFEALFGNDPNNKLTIIQQGKFRPPKPKKIKTINNAK